MSDNFLKKKAIRAHLSVSIGIDVAACKEVIFKVSNLNCFLQITYTVTRPFCSIWNIWFLFKTTKNRICISEPPTSLEPSLKGKVCWWWRGGNHWGEARGGVIHLSRVEWLTGGGGEQRNSLENDVMESHKEQAPTKQHDIPNKEQAPTKQHDIPNKEQALFPPIYPAYFAAGMEDPVTSH